VKADFAEWVLPQERDLLLEDLSEAFLTNVIWALVSLRVLLERKNPFQNQIYDSDPVILDLLTVVAVLQLRVYRGHQ
jgi:hypothetical protein